MGSRALDRASSYQPSASLAWGSFTFKVHLSTTLYEAHARKPNVLAGLLLYSSSGLMAVLNSLPLPAAEP